jgi:hypothetical protein
MIYTGATIPTTQIFRVTPYLQAGAACSGTNSDTASASVSDNFGNTATSSASPGQPGVLVNSGQPFLVQITPDPDTGIATLVIKANYSSTANVVGSTSSYGGCSAHSEECFSALPDNRYVTIASNTIDQSYSVDPATVPGYTGIQDKNPIAPTSGQTVGDSAVSWSSTFSQWIADNGFEANAEHFYNPTYSFSWSGSGTLQAPGISSDYSDQSFANANATFGASAKVFPCSSTVNVTAQDGSDGTRGSASYTVRWHLPYEPTQMYQETYDRSIVSSLVAGIYPGQMGLKAAAPEQGFDMSAVFETLGSVSAMAGQEELAGPLEIIADAAGITKWEYDFPGEAGDQQGFGSVNSGVNWQVATTDQSQEYICSTPNIPPSLSGNANGWQYCTMSVNEVLKERTQYWWANAFDANGFTGNSDYTIDPTIPDMVDIEPFFWRYLNLNGSPLTGNQ